MTEQPSLQGGTVSKHDDSSKVDTTDTLLEQLDADLFKPIDLEEAQRLVGGGRESCTTSVQGSEDACVDWSSC